MKILKTISVLLLFLSYTTICFAIDWRTLHEKADVTEEATALDMVAANPQKVEALYLLALIYMNHYKINQSLQVFNRLLEISPGNVEAEWGIAEIYRRQRKTEESTATLEEIIKNHPDFAPAKISLAYLKFIQRDFNRAVQLADDVIQHGQQQVDLGNYVRAYTLHAGAKGMIAYYGGPVSKIVNGTFVHSTLKHAEKLDPQAPEVLFGLGSYYLLTPPFLGRDLTMAEKYLRQAVERDPQFPDVYVRLAQVYQLKGNQEKYHEFLSKSLALDPQSELALDIKNGTCKFVCVAK